MLPRRFALIRHVDYSGGAGTGVIAYGVAFDDGQVVLRWSSAHRATSVLDSVEDLVAAHGHGETTSIEWIDAPPGKADAPGQAGRRARRPARPAEEQPATDDEQVPKPPATAPTEPAGTRPAAQMPEPHGPAHARPAAQTPDSDSGEHVPAPIPQARAGAASTQSPADPAQPAAGSTSQGPTTPAQPGTPAQPAAPAHPATPAQPAAHAQPTQPAAPAQPATPTPPAAHAPATSAPEQPAANQPSLEPAQRADDSSTQPNVAASLGVARMAQNASPDHEPAPDQPAPASRPAAHAAPASNGAGHLSNTTHPAETPFSRNAPSRDDERRARHEAIATQPMSAELSDEPEPRRPRRAGPPAPHESPRSIFDEAEQPSRPDLRLASSNGQVRDADEVDDSADESARREAFGGFFSTGHQHLETVTGLLDLPAGLNKRGRGAESDQDTIASRRNGRHRGE